MRKREKKSNLLWFKQFTDVESATMYLTFPEMGGFKFRSLKEELDAWQYNLDLFREEIEATASAERWQKNKKFWYEKNVEILKLKISKQYDAYCQREAERHAADAREILDRYKKENVH